MLFCRSVENERADPGWVDRTRLARPNFQTRTGTGKYSAEHEQDWHHTRLIHTLLKVMTIHTCISGGI